MICIKAFKPINMEPFDNQIWKQYFFLLVKETMIRSLKKWRLIDEICRQSRTFTASAF